MAPRAALARGGFDLRFFFLSFEIGSFCLDNLLSLEYYLSGDIEMVPASSVQLPYPISRNSFAMHAYEKFARNSFAIHAYGAKDLKSTGMNTYKKHPGGGVPQLPSHLPLEGLNPSAMLYLTFRQTLPDR